MGSYFQPIKSSPAKASPKKRTFTLWVLISGFLVLSLYGWARMIYSIQGWYWLNFSDVYPGPAYLAVTGGLWGISGLAAMVWIYPLRKGYRLVGVGAALFMALLYWIDRILYNRSGGIGPNASFAILMTFFLLAYTALVLNPFPRQQKTGVTEINNRESDVKI